MRNILGNMINYGSMQCECVSTPLTACYMTASQTHADLCHRRYRVKGHPAQVDSKYITSCCHRGSSTM